MKKPFVFLAAFAALLSFSIRGGAQAPPDQYDPFTESDATITDHYTRLAWSRSSSNVLATDGLIDAYCIAPSRLPTVKELLTIVDEVPNPHYDSTAMPPRTLSFFIDTEVFPDIVGRTDKPYCTQTKDVGSGARYTVDFASGTTGLNAAGGCHVRCVQYIGP
ncbi:MAG TPA: hypothetical protein VIF62_15055 [Labilithrix sp.]